MHCTDKKARKLQADSAWRTRTDFSNGLHAGDQHGKGLAVRSDSPAQPPGGANSNMTSLRRRTGSVHGGL